MLQCQRLEIFLDPRETCQTIVLNIPIREQTPKRGESRKTDCVRIFPRISSQKSRNQDIGRILTNTLFAITPGIIRLPSQTQFFNKPFVWVSQLGIAVFKTVGNDPPVSKKLGESLRLISI